MNQCGAFGNDLQKNRRACRVNKMTDNPGDPAMGYGEPHDHPASCPGDEFAFKAAINIGPTVNSPPLAFSVSTRR